MSLESFSFVAGISLILGQIILVLGWVLFFANKVFRNWLLTLMNERMWIFASFLVILGSIIGSLIYSNIYLLPICELCWYQRMTLYPQAIILTIALWRREYQTAIYSSLTLSFVGFLISMYHYSLNLQKLFNPAAVFAPCDASGISCADIPVLIFGYITIPFMTIVVTLMMMNLLVLAMKTKKGE